MREYIFRGKTDRDYWVEGSLITVGDRFCCILPQDYGCYYEYPYLDGDLGTIDGQAIPVIQDTVGQWTGLLDKKSNKIFEGDIVKAKMDYGPGGFHDSCVTIRYDVVNGYRWEYFDISTIEVVGNIHDNPELIGGKTNEG